MERPARVPIRSLPRDALVVDSVEERHRGLAFGLHRAADTAGAMLGLVIALLAVWIAQKGGGTLQEQTFAPFFFGAALALVAAVTMALWKPPVRQSAESS
jgi:MFS family permease